MDWFSKHTQWLYDETHSLSNSSIYKESFQCINSTLISTGHLKVHKEKTEYHPILVVYPETTPYVLPTIYILQKELDQKTALQYSNKTPDLIREHVKGNVKILSRRHQNEDGSICFVETGDLHSDNPELFTIKDIIKRLRIWLSGKIPKDSREVELFSHFPNKTNELEFLIPDLFFITEICKGSFFAGLSSIIAANSFEEALVPKTYMGITIFGENENGITFPPKEYVNQQLILYTPSGNMIEMITQNSDQKAEAIRDGKLLEGYWWDIKEEPQPFTTVEELAWYIGNSDHETGIAELVQQLKEPLKKAKEKIYIGIRFPGRWQKKDWQFFVLVQGKRLVIVEDSIEEHKHRLLDYSIKAVRQEYFTDGAFHLRNQGRAERKTLNHYQLSIIGCGALGSETADALSKAGIGKINLIDKEVLRAHNTVRHCIGLNRIAFPKVIAMAEHIALHNPFVIIDNTLAFIDITRSDINKYIPGNSIGLSTIADDNIEAYLNEKAIDNNKTLFFCRALRGGKTARIFRVIPGKDACKACLSIYRTEGDPRFIDIEEDDSLPPLTNECNNPVRPGSAADMKIISGLFSRIIIDYLQNPNVDLNHWIWTTETIKGLSVINSGAGMIHPEKIPPHPECNICQQLDQKKAILLKSEYLFMKQEIEKKPEIETGGILIGQRTIKGEYFIHRATGPGPNALMTENRFEKDETHCQQELEKSLAELGEKGLYIGEWHYHPRGSNSPSGQDIKSLTEIANQEHYRIENPVMIILSPDMECALTIHDKYGSCVNLNLEVNENF